MRGGRLDGTPDRAQDRFTDRDDEQKRFRALLYAAAGERDDVPAVGEARALLAWALALDLDAGPLTAEQRAGRQHNLGYRLSKTPVLNPAANLQRAIELYQDALRVRTEAALPQDWAMTMFNLGLTYDEADRRGEALAVWARALPTIEAAGDHERAAFVREELARG